MTSVFQYPAARRGADFDDYHGVRVEDPFRWLENPDSEESRVWINAENKLTEHYLSAVPERATIHRRLKELWNYERYGIPSARGGRYLFTRNDGLQNQSVLYVAESLAGEPRVLLDPNQLSKDGTISLTGYELSDDGKLLAYGLSSGGSDWEEWRVRDVATGQDLDDHLRWVKFSAAAWTPDNKGFFYSRYDEPKAGAELTEANYFQKLYYHRIGAPQSEDRLVYERTDQKEWGFGGFVTDDGRFLIISVWRGTERANQVFYLDLEDPASNVVELLSGFDAQYYFLVNEGTTFYFRTDRDAPRQRVIAIDVANPAPNHWREIVPETKDVIEHATAVGGRIFVMYLHDAHSRVRMFDHAGKDLGDVDLPGLGTADGFGGRQDDEETFFAYTGFTAPTTIYRYDLKTNQAQVFRAPQVAFEPNLYEAKQVFYQSKDGTRVPMFIVHRRGIQLDGSHPTYLYGYGGFNIPLTPNFSPGRIAWLEMGGIFAMPNLRGGGEYGREWHEGGKKLNKQNVFDDFIAAAEYLIAEKYTSPGKLAIAGRSNGGLLAGACLVQRPDLFGAALPGVGVLDMLRFHRFTIGWAWVSDYGSADNPDEFQALYAYSPLHNIRPDTKYPPTLITTADHDDRVVPAHSFKFAAALQAAQAGDAPVLIRIETQAGHGAGMSLSKQLEELADSYAFLVRALDMRVPADFSQQR